MKRIVLSSIAIVLSVAVAQAEKNDMTSVTNEGWTVTADGRRGILSITHDNLGTILQTGRLGLRGEHDLVELRNWVIEKEGQDRLSLKTVNPRTAWVFDLGQNALKISATSTRAVLSAQAPAPRDRVVARILDPQGVPVDWVGTDEVASSYGGSETRNLSFLPTHNPECMYFALGQVSSANFHSLFDRESDTAICFPDQAVMQLNTQVPNLLDVTIPVPGNTLVRLIPDYYTKTLGAPYYTSFDDTNFATAPMVWGSWTSCYAEVREEDIVKNTDWIARYLKPYGFEYVQLDDGYDRGKKGEHFWIENWDRVKFPHGPKWLTNYIRSKGLHAGLWLVPNAYAGAMERHPDWYLRDKTGKIILDYSTPALDSTNPAVLDFLKKLFSTLGEWGFEYYKFDGEHALPLYAPGVDRDRLYDKSIDPLLAYRNRLNLIRETIGPKTFVEGCPAGTPLNGIGYFNSYFTGQDVYNSWQGMYALFSSINANAFLNHMLVYVMPGEGIDVAPPMSVEEAKQKSPSSVVETARTREEPMVGFGTTMAESRTLVTFVALTGVTYSLASALPGLPLERIDLLRMTLPTMHILPVDLYSRGTDLHWDTFKHTTPDTYIHNYPEILDLKVNAKSGVYDVVGLTNWQSEMVKRNLRFAEKLGLSEGSSYIAFDFWNQQLLGVFKDGMEVSIGPHDTRVLSIHPLLNRPQLIGISRHITGAYSILDQGWDASKKQLHGLSETVPKAAYSLCVFIPEGMIVSRVRATTNAGAEIPVRQKLAGNSLTFSFQGQEQAVDWQVEFADSVGAVQK